MTCSKIHVLGSHGLSKSGLDDQVWTVRKMITNMRHGEGRKWREWLGIELFKSLMIDLIDDGKQTGSHKICRPFNDDEKHLLYPFTLNITIKYVGALIRKD